MRYSQALQRPFDMFGIMHFLILFIVIISSNVSSPKALEKLAFGQTVYVACKTVSVYVKPSAFSEVKKNLRFGDVLKVEQFEGIFELPNSDYSSRIKLEQANSRSLKQGRTPLPINRSDYTRPTWVKVNAEQYVPASCLVGEGLFKEQVLEKAEKRVLAVITQKAKRNFSEEEDGDLRAMRGAAGKAEGGSANFAAIDRLIDHAQGKIDPVAQQAFRKEGYLGEFK